MKNLRYQRTVIILLLISLLVPILTACGKGTTATEDNSNARNGNSKIATAENMETEAVPAESPTESPAPTPTPTVPPTPTPTPVPGVFDGLTDKQRDSISMLNYLTVLTQKINESKNSRIYLEEAYSSIVNNTYPNAVDSRTLSELEDLLDILESFRMTEVKRERLEYLYNQDKAQGILSALPNPLALLSAVNSFNIVSLVSSVGYMAADSISKAVNSSSDKENLYLKDSWVLDDEEATVLHEQRKSMFSYLVETVNENDIPGELTLTEDTVTKLVEWSNNTNVVSRLQFLEKEQETYKAYGGYWLTLAKTYYENGNYLECLQSIDAYEDLGIRIFRKDYDYADIMPSAIAAAGEILEGDEYITRVNKYVNAIVENTDSEDWALLYFAAQTNMILYDKTGESEYIQAAYDITIDNVNNLVAKQQDLNQNYLSDVKLLSVPEGATKEEKKEIEQYNDQLKENRKTELPSLYEPLMLNCELLFGLADKLNIHESEINKINTILSVDSKNVFPVKQVAEKFTYKNSAASDQNYSNLYATFDGEKLTLSAENLSSLSKVSGAVVKYGRKELIIDDLVVSKVTRENVDDLTSFRVVFTSKKIKDFRFEEGHIIKLTVTTPCGSAEIEVPVEFEAMKKENSIWKLVYQKK